MNMLERLLEYVPGTVIYTDPHGRQIRASINNIYDGAAGLIFVDFNGCEQLVDGEWVSYDQRSYGFDPGNVQARNTDLAGYMMTLYDGTVISFMKTQNSELLDRTAVLVPQTAAG